MHPPYSRFLRAISSREAEGNTIGAVGTTDGSGVLLLMRSMRVSAVAEQLFFSHRGHPDFALAF